MRLRVYLMMAALATAAVAQTVPPHPSRKTSGPAQATEAVSGAKLQSRQRFALEVVRTAVSLPQPDPQDRLRVLASAVRLAAPLAPALARRYARDGAQLEIQLISSGQIPLASIFDSGLVDCATFANFVESVPATAVAHAQAALMRAVSQCPRETLDGIQRKLEEASRQGEMAPQALLAAMEAAGWNSPWTQQQFQAVFASLPDPRRAGAEAPNFAVLYQRAAEDVDREIAQRAGLNFLQWLGKLPESPERLQSITAVSAIMRKILGAARYEEALQTDVLARQAAQSAGQPFEMAPPDDDAGPSVLHAMSATGQDHADELEQLAPTRRARQAAAYGFASGTAGDNAAAERYFETAFSALEDVWANRGPHFNAVPIVEEVTQAAAQVNPVAALARATKLRDPAAQAISMLAVAQVVLAKQDSLHPSAQQASR